ncbi:CPBP family intramembrane metalloprotease [Occultella glacieicola]|uniref:CPBP family intramembrane metalloprotease n=1 Tax=Occultella glacieicola TaxID=2518684 RepID=A0ABY2E710_9MICO|nr:CPBP family intramembrane glutamic endopeptidase [Occultella glacieicola]TDE97340.1 CPBP family intramembrane metalloprotease [Occultella glacieicola]
MSTDRTNTNTNTKASPAGVAGPVSFLARLAIAVGLLAGGLLLLVATAADGEPTEVRTLAVRTLGGIALSAAMFALVAILARRVDRRPLSDLGITGPRDGWRAFTTGVLAWLLPAAVVLAILALTGTTLALRGSPGEVATVIGLTAAAVLFSEAIPEELVFRGYVTSVLEERLRGWWIILVQATLFAAFAVVLRGFTGVADLSLFVGMGIGLGYLRLVTGSVWTSVGFHAAFQTVSQLLLTHDVVEFGGSPAMTVLALGIVPFAVGITLVAALATTRPGLFRRRRASADVSAR